MVFGHRKGPQSTTATRVTLLLLAISLALGVPHSALGATGLVSKADWYPVDRGQAPGVRVLNYWTNGVFDPATPHNFRGQSTLNFGGPPAFFPATYGGNAVKYFINWTCMD